MDYNLFYLFSILITILVIIILSKNIMFNDRKEENKQEYDVYCLMITGYKPERVAYAKKSVINFLEQNYENKYLVILNQSSENIIEPNQTNERIFERKVAVDKLGILRNKSLEMVPTNAVWTTWDDDDYRHPQYLSIFMKEFCKHDVDFLMFQNRLEYNISTKFKFKIKLKSGTMIFFSKLKSIKYEPVESMEDQIVKKTALRHFRCKIIDNDPKLYMRLIHDCNTSLYVNNDKNTLRDTSKHVDYFESPLTSDEKEYLDKIISSYY